MASPGPPLSALACHHDALRLRFAPAEVRGPYQSIPTSVPGVRSVTPMTLLREIPFSRPGAPDDADTDREVTVVAVDPRGEGGIFEAPGHRPSGLGGVAAALDDQIHLGRHGVVDRRGARDGHRSRARAVSRSASYDP